MTSSSIDGRSRLDAGTTPHSKRINVRHALVQLINLQLCRRLRPKAAAKFTERVPPSTAMSDPNVRSYGHALMLAVYLGNVQSVREILAMAYQDLTGAAHWDDGMSREGVAQRS